MKYQEICMEQTHSRSKCKREFKGVLNKVLVSGLALAMVMGSSTTAFAAGLNIKDLAHEAANKDTNQITSEYGVSVDSAISQIRNTINSINQMKANGSVSDNYIKNLASQIYALETAATSDSSKMSDVTSVLNEAESAVKGLSNASEAETAIKIVRGMLGVSNISVKNTSAAITDFKDIPANAWYYNYVSRMVQDGLFAGTSATTFSPDAPMSEVQFLTVVLRKAFPNELTQYNAQYTSSWFDGAYRLGLAKGIISQSVYGSGADMNARNITRERMTDIAIKGLEAMGEQTYSNAAGVSARVTDLKDCSGTMRDSMIKAYTMGIIAGTSDTTVSPKQTATRAQGATVLYRFAYPDERSIPDLNAPVEKPGSDLSQPITIYEGQTRTAGESRLAREGDVFVKADGTKVILKKGPNGVLGEGQGVAPDLGFEACENPTKQQVVTNQGRFSPGGILGEYDTNSVGKPYNNDDYKVNPWTGEGHWGTEWHVIKEANPMPAEYGSYNGQISSNGVWVWLADYNTWDLCCNWPDTSYFQ